MELVIERRQNTESSKDWGNLWFPTRSVCMCVCVCVGARVCTGMCVFQSIVCENQGSLRYLAGV